MSGRPQKQRYQAVREPRTPAHDFVQGDLYYMRERRRWRNRRYRLIAALLILGVGTSVIAVLLADWLSSFIK
jgi:hypothetical protein